MTRLFNVYMSDEARKLVAQTITPDSEGRMCITQGPGVDAFERQLQSTLGLETAPAAVNSCTSALILALRLAGVRDGDEVVSTPMTCAATNAAILTIGATIRWADVHPDSGLINVDEVHRKMTPSTRAIMAVDWAGALPDYKGLRSLGVPVIEDAAHAFLTVRAIGHEDRGDYVCWSFQAIKHLTTGDGGALLAPLEQMERARTLRWYGLDRSSNVDFRSAQRITESGYKFNMNDINAAIGLGNIRGIADIVRSHRARAAVYNTAFGYLKKVKKPAWTPGSSWWIYCVRVPDPNAFIGFMKEKGIETSRVHSRNDRHPAMAFYSGPLPGVDEFSGHEVAIPCGWWLTDWEVEDIVTAVQAFDEIA